MRFYNPFKAHIVAVDNYFAVRRFRFFWWEYKSKNIPDTWHVGQESLAYCLLGSAEECERRFIESTVKFVKSLP